MIDLEEFIGVLEMCVIKTSVRHPAYHDYHVDVQLIDAKKLIEELQRIAKWNRDFT